MLSFSRMTIWVWISQSDSGSNLNIKKEELDWLRKLRTLKDLNFQGLGIDLHHWNRITSMSLIIHHCFLLNSTELKHWSNYLYWLLHQTQEVLCNFVLASNDLWFRLCEPSFEVLDQMNSLVFCPVKVQ